MAGEHDRQQTDATTGAMSADVRQSPAWQRLEDQIGWYDRKSLSNQRWFKRIKVAQIAVAAAIPAAAGAGASAAVAGVLGAVIVVLEGIQQLFQYQQNWITYRSTCEALKHEKYLFQSAAGPYADARRPEALLAERVEGLVSQEHAKWTASREESTKRQDASASPSSPP
jgi:hypothetical protein